jgi:cell division protein FtsX
VKDLERVDPAGPAAPERSAPEPSASGPTTLEQPGAPEPVRPVAARSAWRGLALIGAGAVVSMLIGAAAAFGVFHFAGMPGQSMQRFTVHIHLDTDVTPEQKAAVQAKLPLFEPVGQVKLKTKEEALRDYQELRKINSSFPEVSDASELFESFSLEAEAEGFLFDCAGYTAVRHMPGVARIQVLQGLVNDYVATITCSAEYARP